MDDALKLVEAVDLPQSLAQLKTRCSLGIKANSLVESRAAVVDCEQALAKLFAQGHRGRELVSFRTRFIDHLLTELWSHYAARHQISRPIALIAVGGYGRGELHLYSDIDLLLLVEKPRFVGPLKNFIQEFLTTLWDLRLEIGHSTRSLKQCVQEARKDIAVATNLMETRLLAGPEELLHKLNAQTGPGKIWPSAKFLAAKQEEQAKRHRDFGDSAYQLEPNIKESPGGLRDLQIIGWVAKRHFAASNLSELVEHRFLDQQEYDYLMESQEFLWQVRNGVHLLAGHKDDHFTFDHQRTLATLFGYVDQPGELAVEQLMKRYFRIVMELNRFSEMVLQCFQEETLLRKRKENVVPVNSRFQVRNGYLEVVDDKVFSRYPFALLEAFLIIQSRPEVNGMRAETTRLIRKNLHLIDNDFRNDIRATSLFMEILRQPSGISHELRRMNRYGVLARYIPAFDRVVGQMQHDLFHIYTVDEHTLWVIRNVRSFAAPEWCPDVAGAPEIFRRLPKPELLYLAALFHDIGKGQGGDHSGIGAEQARRFCHRHGLSKYDSALVAWLVQHHLEMSILSQKEDTSDPDVIRRFAKQVGDITRLDYLYLLTIADMKGTSHKVWNSWKSALLDTLYFAARREINRELTEPAELALRITQVQETVLSLLQTSNLAPEAVRSFFTSLAPEYFLRLEPRLIAWHAKSVIGNPHPPIVEIANFEQLGSTAILVYLPDKNGLFATLTCELSRLGLDVVDAKISTTSNQYALDTFLVLNERDQPVTDERQLEQIRSHLRQALSAEKLLPRLPKRRSTRQQQAFSIPTRVNFYTDHRRDRTVMELVTGDRPGLLAAVAIVLNQLQLSVSGARINTYGERAEDIFFLVDEQGHAINSADVLDQLSRQLCAELDPGINPVANVG